MKIQIFHDNNVYFNDRNVGMGKKYIPFDLYIYSLIEILKKNNYNFSVINNIKDIDVSSDYLIMFVNNIFHIDKINTHKMKMIFIIADKIEILAEHNYLIEYMNNNGENVFLWDYSSINFHYLKRITNTILQNNNDKAIGFKILQYRKYHYYSPICYNIFLENLYNMENDTIKDIDVLFIGNYAHKRRIDILNDVSIKHPVTVFVGVNDIRQYIKYVKRAKIVLSIFSYEHNKPFDFYRLALLYSNRAFVINEEMMHFDFEIQPHLIEFSKIMINVKTENIAETVDKYLSMTENERNEIADATYLCFKQFSMEQNINDFFTENTITNTNDTFIDKSKGEVTNLSGNFTSIM